MHRSSVMDGLFKESSYLFVIALLVGIVQFAPAQSRIPAEANNYIQTTGAPANGDQDSYMVVFYEVPDTITSTLYFAINHPGIDTATPTAPNNPDQGTAGASWNYYLVGGTGTLSSATSRQLTFASLSEATTGTILDTKSYINENGWNYFAGVSPSQGEHIGNKYYFKIVAQAPNGDKNGFQLDVSYSNSGTPTGDPNIRAFAYCWTLALLQRAGTTWNLYPFVPEGATGNIDYRNWDMDSGENLAAWDKSGSSLAAPTVSGNGVTWPADIATSSYPIGSETNGTWRLQVTETNGGEPAVNTSMFWFENPSGTILRTYAASYTPPAPSYVTITPTSATAITGTNQGFTLQIVDSGGNPVPYVRNIYVTVSGSATISPNNNGGAGDELIATNGDGLATFTVTDAVAETVTVTFYWNGTGGSSNFGTSSFGTATVTFQADLPPSISSASNLTYYSNQAAPINLPTITISDSGTANITAANDIRIRIPSSLQAEFLTSVTTPTLTVGGTGGGAVNATVSYPTSKTLLIDVTANFAVTNTLTIGGATPLQFNAATDAPSSGRLELSVDGGATWTSVDDKLITILDPNPTYTWSGNTDTSWTTGSNWAGGVAPSLNDGTENIIIPSGRPYYPVLPAANWSINQLTIDAGASLTIGANNLTINGTFNNNGILIISGAGRPSKNDTDSGTVRYTVAGGTITDFGATDYYNLELNGAGAFSAGSAIVVANSLTITNSNGVTFTSTLSASTVTLTNTSAGQTIDFQGAVTIGTLSTAAQGYNVRFGAGGTITNAVTFSNTGTLVIANGMTFTGGVTATAPSSKSLAGTISTTNAAINFGTAGTITLTGNTTLSSGSGNITLYDIPGPGNFNLTLTGSGTNTLGVVNLGTGTLDLSGLSGGTTSVDGALTAQALSTPAAAVNLVFNGGAGAQTSSITGAGSTTFANGGTLTLGNDSGDSITFTGGVTATTPSSVSVGGTIATGGGAGQNITLGDGDTPVVLIADTVLSAGAGNITLGGTVNADAAANNRTLTLNSTGITTLGGAVGGGQALGSLTTNAGGTTQINGGGVTTTGAQTYNDNVTLGANTTLTTTNSTVTFSGTVNGAQSLTVSVGTGLVSFGGAVGGGTALSSVSVTSTNGAPNAITLRNVTTSGTQTYTGNVTLGAATSLTTTSNGSVSITGTVSGAQDFTLSANGTGTVSFGGDVTVGATAAGALSISASSLSLGSGVDISTAGVNGNISLTVDGLSLGGTNTINAGTGTFALTPRTGTYTVEFSPTDTALVTDVYYNSAFTGITAGAFRVGSAAHTGTIYVATAAMTPPYSLTVQNNGSIVVAGSYNSSAGNGNLTLDSGAGGIALNGGTIDLGNGTFTAQDAVTLGANTTITANGGIAFQGTIDADNAANNRTLTLNCSGAVTLSGAVGATQALQTLTSNAGGTLSLLAVTTRGAQTYNDATVTLNGTLTVNTAGAGVSIPNSVVLGAGGGTITLTGTNGNNDITLGTVSGAQALNLTAGGGDITIGSTDGTPTSLTSTSSTFTSTGSVTVAAGGSVSITADQIALGNTLGNSGAGTITLQPTSDAVTIGLNDPAGTFNLTATELGYLTTTGTVTIGRATGTGAITIGGSGATNISGTTYNLTIEGATSPVSFAASTLSMASGKALTFSNGGNITVTAGATHVAIAGAGTVAFPQAGSVGASGNPLVVNVANLGASTLTGGLYLQAQANLTVSGIITTNNNPVEIDTGANTFSSGVNIDAGTSTFTLTASDVNLTGGLITANGGIVFQPNTDGAAIYLNNPGAGFSLDATELTSRIDSTGTVTIGRSTGTGTITIGGSGSINAGGESYNFTLRGASSPVVFNFGAGNTLTLPNNRTFTINTGGAVTSPGATTADITIGGTGSLSILSATTVGTLADPLRLAVANITGIAADGDVYIQDADGFTITGAVTNIAAAPVLSFNGETGTITTSGAGTITSGSGGGGSLILTADDMGIGATLTANGGILIQPFTAARPIALNDGTAGTLSLTTTELQNLSCTGTVTIGRSTDGSGTIYIAGSGAINLGATSYNLTIEGNTSPISFAANTLTLAAGKTLTFSNGGNITVASGATHVAIPGVGTVAFPQAGNVGSSGNPLVVNVANLGACTLLGGLYLEGQTNLTVSGAVSAVGVEIDTGTNSLTVSNTIASGVGNLSLTADTLAIGAALSGTGTLTLQPASAGRLVSIGTSGAQFDVDDTELGFLQNGFSSITIGRNTSGAVTVDTATFVDPVTILSGSTVTLNAGSPTLFTSQDNASITVTANGTITVNGAVSAHGTGSVTLTATGGASNIALAADIQSASNGTLTLTAGGNITRSAGTVGAAGSSSPLVLSAGASIGASGAAVVTNVGTIRASAGGNIYLSEANAVQLGDGGGNITTNGGLIDIVTGGAISFGNTVTTTGAGTTITLNAASGGIAISQNIASANNAAITLTAGGGGSISRTAGTVGAGGSTSLLVLSAGGAIGASGAAVVTDVGTIRATAGGDIYISEASGVQLGDASGPITTTNGVINITASGNITTGVWGGGDILSTSGGTGSITITTLAGGTITLSDSVASVEGGLVTLTNAGALTISAPITARGGFDQNGAGAVSLGANITTTGDAINFLRAVTLTGGVSLDTTNGGANPAGGNVTFQSTTSGAQALTLNGGTGGTVTFTGAVGATPLTALTVSGALSTVFSSSVAVNGPVSITSVSSTSFASTASLNGATSITSNEINFTGGAGSFSGNSTLVLQPYTASQAIAIGGAADTGGGTLDLIASDIAALANGFTSITIGSATGTGAITVSGAVTFLDPVTIRSPAGAGSITVNGQITGSDNASITLDAGTGGISLGASIVTAGNSITLQDAATVTANISLDTTNGGAVPVGALINLNGTVNGDVADTRQLTLRCGQQTLTITQGIGGTIRLSVLTIRSDDLSLSANLRAQTINLYTGTPATRAMVIGDSVGGAFSLSDAELALLSGFSTLVIGENGQQAATVTVRTATSPVPAASITVYADSGAGGIVLDDQGTSTALATGGSGNITLVAGTGGITSSNATNGVAELSTSGTISLTSAGSIGSAPNRIQFPAGQANVTVTNAPGGVWFGGLGALTLGAITTNSTGAPGLDVTSAGLLTLAGAVSTSSGNITLDSAGNGVTANNTITGNSLTITNGGAVDLNNTVTVPNGFSSAGTSFDNTGATITTTGTAITINHTGAVTVGASLSAGNGVITVTSTGSSVSITAAITGGSGAVSVTSSTSTVTLAAPITMSTGAVSIDSATGTTVTASGDITATGAAPVNFGQTLAGPISTEGDVTTVGGPVRFYRQVTLTGNLTISTGAGNITFDSTINADNAANNRALTLNSTGATTLGGAVGGVQSLGSLTTDAGGTTQINGGAVTTSGAQTYNDGVVLGANTTLNAGAGNISFASTVNADNAANNRTLTLNSTGTTTLGGAVGGTQSLGSLTTDAGGTTQVNGGGVTTTGAQTYNDAVVLGANTTLTTTSGPIQFAQDLSGAFTLTVNGGTGNVTFSNTIGGGADPTGISITTSGDVSFAGAVNIGGNLTVTGTDVAVNSGIYSSATGNVQITQSGTLTIQDTTSVGDDTTADINILGSFTQISGGGGSSVSIRGDIVTSSGNSITFNSPLTLTGNVLLQANGAGNISCASTVDANTVGSEGLRFYTDTGSISVTGNVGGVTRLAALTITTTGNALFTGNVTATSFTQAGGSGTTIFNGIQDYTGNLSFTGTDLVQFGATTVGGNYTFTGAALTVNNALTVTGATTITNSGLFTKSATGAIIATGGFTQNGTGSNSIGADISTTNANLSFATGITLTQSVQFSTGAGAGDITLSSTVNPQAASTQGLTLVAGTGNIDVMGPVGNLLRLGDLTVSSANNATFTGGVTAESFSQTAGSGTTTFTAGQDYARFFNFTGTNLVQNGPCTVGETYDFTGAALTVNNALTVTGATTITNSGLFTKGATGAITATGGFTQNGTGANSIGANISTTNTNLSFATGITLTQNVQFSTGGGAGDITLSSTVNPQAASTQGLTLVAGTGNISVTGPVGGGQRLGDLTVSSANNATFTNNVTATSFTQVSGSGTTTFNGAQDYTGAFSFTGTNLVQQGAATVGGNYTFTGAALTVNNALTVTGTTTITNSGLFTKGATGVITATGGFTQNGTGNVDIKSDLTTTNQPIQFNSAVHVTNSAADVSWNAGTATIQNLGGFDLHIYSPGRTLNLYSNLTARNVILYAGTVNLNPTGTDPKNLNTLQDLVLFGSGYNNDDDDADDGTGGNIAADVFAYTSLGRTVDGGTRADPSVTTVPSAYLQGAPYNLPAELQLGVGANPPNYGAAAFANLAGSTLTVGKNFYANGTALNSNTGNWNLVIQSDVDDAAVAFAEAYNLTVNYCQATRTIAAAENVTASDSVNWDTTRAVLVPGNPGLGTGTYTVYDDVIRVEFSKPIENSRNEINEIIGYSSSVTNLRTDNGTIAFTGAYVDPECTVSTNGAGDLSVFYLKVADANRWNTDATGTSAGNVGSTDRGRPGIPPAHRSRVPNLWFAKTGEIGKPGWESATTLNNFFVFRDSSKNRVRSTARETQAGTTGYTTGRFTSVADGCRPVLVAVQRGRAPHDEDSTGNPLTYRPYDAHNYFHLRYSEPINIGTDPAFQIGSGSPASNLRAQTSFSTPGEWGGHLSSSGGTATLVGFFSYPGTINPGSRDGNVATNSLYRASLQGENPSGDLGLTIYVSGYSFTSGSERYWPGYHSNLSNPAGQTITVLPNNLITDSAGNAVEPTSNPYTKATITIGSTPTTPWNPSNASLGVGMPPSNLNNWDTDPPAFSTYLPGDIKEVVSRATTITNLVNRMEFFIQDNSTEDVAWDPTEHWTGTPDPDAHPDRVASRSHFGQPDVPRGMRDSTWSYPDALDKKLAFQFEAVGITPLLNTYNTGFDTTVNNTLFTEVNTRDDPYFTVLLQDTGHPWGLITQLWFTYDHTKAYLTDLAGNLLPSTPYPYLAIEGTPPMIELALASANDSKVYVKFSEPVFGDRNNSVEIASSKFTLNNGFSVTRVEPITRGDNPISVYDAWLYLNRTLTPDEILTTTLALEGPVSGDPTKGVWDKTGNAALSTDVHRITDVGLGVVTPLWASDGLAVEGKPMDQSSNTLRVFDGTGRLQVRDIVLQARIEAASFTNLPLTLFYDVDVPEQYFNKTDDDPRRNFPHIWLPIRLRGLNPLGNPFSREVFPYESQGALKNFLLPGTDTEFQSGKKVEFIFRLGNLFCARLADPTDPTSLVPWSFMLQEPIRQRGGVSIYNNVINPENGEKVVLTYEVTRPGMVTVQVFSLDGSLVYVIHRGPQGKGTYTYTWSGRNMGNRIVARGIYFIRVVGPDMDEIRKVMVVK